MSDDESTKPKFRKEVSNFDLFEYNTKTPVKILIKDYFENGKNGYNMHWVYEVKIGDKVYSVFSDLYYSVFNEEDERSDDESDETNIPNYNKLNYRDYWTIVCVPRPKDDINDLIRAAIMTIYSEDKHATNCQEVSDWFENLALTARFNFDDPE